MATAHEIDGPAGHRGRRLVTVVLLTALLAACGAQPQPLPSVAGSPSAPRPTTAPTRIGGASPTAAPATAASSGPTTAPTTGSATPTAGTAAPTTGGATQTPGSATPSATVPTETAPATPAATASGGPEPGGSGEPPVGGEGGTPVYTNTRFGYSVDVPGAMTEAADGSAAYEAKGETLRISVVTGAAATDPMAIAQTDWAQVQAEPGFKEVSAPASVTIAGRAVVRFVWQSLVGSNPVTGKPYRFTSAHYYIPGGADKLAVVAYGSFTVDWDPQNADDLETSFRWQ